MTKRMRDILRAKIQRTGKTTYAAWVTETEREYLIKEHAVTFLPNSYRGPKTQWFYFESEEPLNV